MSLSISSLPASQLEEADIPLTPDLRLDLSTQIITGRQEILELHGLLVELSNRYGQPGAMDHLEYFLTSEESVKKTPHLVLVGADLHLPGAPTQDAVGALLIYEYRVLGCGTGVFATDDTTGRRTLIAPPDARTMVAKLAVESLKSAGARMVVLSLLELSQEQGTVWPLSEVQTRTGWKYAMRCREIPSYLPLEDTMDATLAKMGPHTRRNLRYYRRRAMTYLGSVFVEDVQVSRFEFKSFNRQCAYAVTDELAGRRFDTIGSVPGMFLCGIRGEDGHWLSMLGGRRYRDIVEIDWQMNRSDLSVYSLSTVMRAYFIEHEISQGTRKMFLEGGTPHAMRYSFVTDTVRDIILVRRWWMVSLLRRLAAPFLPKKNFVLDILMEKGLLWQPWG